MKNKDIQQYKTTLDANNAYWMARLSKEIYDLPPFPVPKHG